MPGDKVQVHIQGFSLLRVGRSWYVNLGGAGPSPVKRTSETTFSYQGRTALHAWSTLRSRLGSQWITRSSDTSSTERFKGLPAWILFTHAGRTLLQGRVYSSVNRSVFSRPDSMTIGKRCDEQTWSGRFPCSAKSPPMNLGIRYDVFTKPKTAVRSQTLNTPGTRLLQAILSRHVTGDVKHPHDIAHDTPWGLVAPHVA